MILIIALIPVNKANKHYERVIVLFNITKPVNSLTLLYYQMVGDVTTTMTFARTAPNGCAPRHS